MDYRHTQVGPLGWMLALLAAGMGGAAWAVWDRSFAGVVLACAAALVALLAACFWKLTVEDRGESLAVRFGPLPLFGTRIRYDAMTDVEAGRSSLIDGWGIHYVPGRGWTFNLWGRGCAVIRRGRSVVRVGTDDVEGLVEFLRGALAKVK